MNQGLKSLFTSILEHQDAICLDNKTEREKLINLLTEAFTPDDYSEVVTIAEAIFPNSQVDETMMSCEVIIKTGLFNVAAAGDEAHLVGLSSPEIFPESKSLYCIYGDSDD